VTGDDLTLDELVRVAREGEPVELAASARERMARSREITERAFARGDAVYGLTTGYGVKKKVAVGGQAIAEFSRRQLHDHRVPQGPLAPPDVVRATMVRLTNAFAGGTAGVRPLLADIVIEALNDGRAPAMRRDGSLGASDLAPLSDVAADLLEGIDLEAGEALAFINTSSYGTAWAALAIHDTARLLDAADVAGALALEGFAANPSVLTEGLEEVRRHPGFARALRRLRRLLRGSYLFSDAPRNLQDPLTFRSTAAIQAAARDAVEHAAAIVAVELNASQGNPVVLVDHDTVVTAGNYEVLPLAAALDYARLALAPALTAASERSLKLLDTPWSGLPTGLAPAPDTPDLALSIHAIVAESLTNEAMLLAQPVSFVLSSTAGAEGIEDRATMLPLAARRLAEMVGLAAGVIAIELLVSAQAVDLRGRRPLGEGTARAQALIRERIPFMGPGDQTPNDVTPLRELIDVGGFAAILGGTDEA
jgi:histidine ammonia-lyase